MTALWIVLAVLAFIILLLFCPAVLTASYEETLQAKIRYLFVSYQIAPPKEKKPKKKKRAKQAEERQAEKEAPQESKIKQLIKEQGLSGFLRLMKELTVLAAGAARDILKHVRISRLEIDATVAGEDAADTAVKFGQACSGIYTAAGMITALTKCSQYHVGITPGFEGQKSAVSGYVKARIAPAFVLAAGMKALVKYFKFVLNQKKQETLNTETAAAPRESA